jgi:hypothetical protein
MRKLPIAILAVSLIVPRILAVEPVKSKEGSLAVESWDDLSLKDAARKKDLTCKVYYPKTGGCIQ